MNSRKTLYHLALVCIVLVGALMLAGCQNAAQDTEADETPPPTPVGAVVFTANCAGCHGDAGGGGAKGPAIRPTDKDEAELFTIITDGVAGTDMPAYRGRISEAEVRTVIAYLHQQ